jgi:dolichol-phosphate mannosyltransferase
VPIYSFVIPVLNEQSVLPELHRRLSSVAEQLDGECEFVLVDDGSTDGSREAMLALRDADPRVKLLFLARNFGHQQAITAGLDVAVGDAIVIMDADLQDPPEVALKMAARWREGYEVVHGVRQRRVGEGRLKLWTAHLFYRLLRRVSEVDLPLDSGDFRLADRRVVEVVRTMREPDRYLRGMFAWVGFRQATIGYERDERFAGDTKFSWARMIGFAVDGILGFSVVPLRIILGLGFLMSGVALLMGLVAIGFKLTGGLDVSGWASLTVLVSFLAGVQLIVLGTVGLYVARVYEQGKGRPLYLIAESHGLSSGQPGPGNVLGPQGNLPEAALDPSQRR